MEDIMNRHLIAIALLSGVFMLSCTPAEYSGAHSAQVDTQKAFFTNLKKMCGKRFEGETQFPLNADHPMAGKRLVMSVATCSETELRIPFLVGEDESRTWVLSLTEKGLLFKHDHRHADGTPDEITMYGGLAAPGGTPYLQRFPADADTAKLIPDAKTNVWTLEILPEKQQFTYYLERDDKPRYKAMFNLVTPPK